MRVWLIILSARQDYGLGALKIASDCAKDAKVRASLVGACLVGACLVRALTGSVLTGCSGHVKRSGLARDASVCFRT